MGLCATPPSDAVTLTGFASTPVHVASTGTYIVQPGDTMMAIAARHGISVSELAGVSGLRRDSSVYAGERLTIPASQPSTGVTYIVRSGDTLGNIARQFGTTIKNSMSTNQLLGTRIYVGRQLVIPDATLETADNWMGRIVNLPSGSPACLLLRALRWTPFRHRVSGWCLGPPVGGIAVDRPTVSRVGHAARRHPQLRWAVHHSEVAGDSIRWPSAETRNLTPLATVSASSHLRTDRWGQYQLWMAVDGASETAWVEGVAGPGAGQWIMLTFPGAIEVHSVGLDVGYDKSADIFAKNNRIKRATLIFSNGDQVELGFADKRGVQTIPLAHAPDTSIRTTSVKAVIDEVFPGSKYDDTCLVKIEVWGVAD